MLRLIYKHRRAVRESKNNKVIFTAMQLRTFTFYFYSLEQPDDGYILAETCSWLFFINMSSVRTDCYKFLVIFHQVNVTR